MTPPGVSITTGVIGTEFQNFKGIAGKDVFQMETSLNRGNSGGPLFDVRGFQVGVNTAIARQGEGGVAITGVNFAIKASVVKKWAASKSLLIVYAIESAKTDERVATAEPPSQAQVAEAKPPARNPSSETTEPVPSSWPTKQVMPTNQATGPKAIEPDSGGVNSEGGHEIPLEPQTQRPARPAKNKSAASTHKPQRFESRYVLPAHAYTYKKLFTEVDKIRARAQDAFDDLENQAQRRRQR